MAQLVEILQPTVNQERVEIGADAIFTAIVSGIVLGLLKTYFTGKFPTYISLLGGVVLLLLYGNHPLIRGIGFALTTDGIYSLLKNYVTISS